MGWGQGAISLIPTCLSRMKTDSIAFFMRKSKKKSKNAGKYNHLSHNTCKNYNKVRKNLEVSIHTLR